MGKQRKSSTFTDKANNWRFPFPTKNSGEDSLGCGGGGGGGGAQSKSIIPSRVRNRFETSSHHLLVGLSSSIQGFSRKGKKKVSSCLTSKCHPVGIASSSASHYNGHLNNSGTTTTDNDTNKDELSSSSSVCDVASPTEDDEDGKNENETYARIGDYNREEAAPGHPRLPPPLKPLYFEVPQEEEHQLVERSWIYGEIDTIFSTDSNRRGVIIHGNPGTGKTTIALQLVENSCFGRNMKPENDELGNGSSLVKLASKIVAYHFCQVDNRTTCLVPDFVHSLAAQMCQAPGLSAYQTYLDENPDVQDLLSTHQCLTDPKKAFTSGILAPLRDLHKEKKLIFQDYFFLILDSVDEAESHSRPGNHGDTISGFLSKHILKIPPWFKIIATIRSSQLALLDFIPFKRISLDTMDDRVDADVRQYVSQRLQNLAKPCTTTGSGKKETFPVGNGNRKKVVSNSSSTFPGLKTHLLQLSGGSFLFLKLTIDLIEHGHLVVKLNNFKNLPISLQEVFSLHCNLRFSSGPKFKAVTPILSTCLVALNPLNLLEIYHSVNSLRFKENLAWVEFLRLFKTLQGLLVKRLDATYMFFHSSFRDWLLGKDYFGNARFTCNSEMGHAAIALRLLRVERPLSSHKLLDLAHHLLKANKSLRSGSGSSSSKLSQAILLLSSCENVATALVSPTNIYATNLKVSRLLLLAGASPMTKCPLSGQSILEICTAHGNVPLLDLLLEFGGDVNAENEKGDNLLALASRSGQLDMVRFLVGRGAM